MDHRTNDIRFSIVIPCYNAADFIRRALDSALHQKTNGFEIIAVNDGSTDSTSEIIESYVQKHQNIISCIHQKNAGPAAARNSGISAAKGEYLVFLDADDELLPDALSNFEKALKDSVERYDFVFAGHYSVLNSHRIRLLRPVNRTINNKIDFKRLIEGKGVSPTPGAIAIHRDCFKKISFPASLRCNEDFVCFAHLFALFRGKAISEPVARKYKRPGSLRSDKQAILDALNKSADLLFDASILPEEYFRFKSLYIAKRHLEKARIHFKNKEFMEFRSSFHHAVGVYPSVFFKPRFLFRYIRSFIKLY